MEFYEQSLANRVGSDSLAGRPAEDAFVRWQAAKGRLEGEHFIRLGFDRVSTTAGLVASMDPSQQHLPDYIQVGGHAWEVQGAAEGVWKVKQEKVEALTRYELNLTGGRNLRWFLYNQADDAAVICSHACLLAVLNRLELVENLLDHKSGWLVPAEAFDPHYVFGDPFAAEKAQRKQQEGLL